MTREEILEGLYGLEPWELRRVAWEALLISDGPDKVPGKADGPVKVKFPFRDTFQIWTEPDELGRK